MKVTNPSTIENLRAKNPRTLQSHVDRAIEQSKNKHIENIRVVSANQLKSGDLSIKTTNVEEAEALKQFADDWSGRIGNGASVRVPTYGIIAHGIRMRSMDMTKFEEVKDELLQDNKPFIPLADIKYIGWLSRSAPTKPASSIIIEFTRPVVFSTKSVPGPLVEDQAFTVEGITQVDGSAGVTLRNPWNVINSNLWGTPTTDGLKSLGHGEFDISNEKAQVQCDSVTHLPNM